MQPYGNSTYWTNTPIFYDSSSAFILLGSGVNNQNVRLYFRADYDYSTTSNTFYNLQLRTDYYTGGSITLSNLSLKRATLRKYTKKYGESLGTMPSPVESGYTLQGWYTEKSGGTKVDQNTLVTGDATYYAHWVKN